MACVYITQKERKKNHTQFASSVVQSASLSMYVYYFHMYKGMMNESTKETRFNNAITVTVSSMFETVFTVPHTNVTNKKKED